MQGIAPRERHIATKNMVARGIGVRLIIKPFKFRGREFWLKNHINVE